MIIIWLAWAAMVATALTCGAVSIFTHNEVSALPMEPDKLKTLISGLGVISGALGVGAILIRRRLLSREAMVRAMQGALEERGAGYAGSVEEAKDTRGLGGSVNEVTLAKALFMPYVLCWACAEAIAIHGFTLSRMIAQPGLYAWFGTPAVILLLICRPDGKSIKAVAAQYESR